MLAVQKLAKLKREIVTFVFNPLRLLTPNGTILIFNIDAIDNRADFGNLANGYVEQILYIIIIGYIRYY